MNSQVIANGDYFIVNRNFTANTNLRRSIGLQTGLVMKTFLYFVVFMSAFMILAVVIRATFESGYSITEEIGDMILVLYGGGLAWTLPVLGICMPLDTRTQMSFGLTRRQFSLSMFVGAAILSLISTAVNAVVSVFLGSFTVESAIFNFLVLILLWHYGWIVAIGFQFMHTHFLCAVAGILAAISLATITFSHLFARNINADNMDDGGVGVFRSFFYEAYTPDTVSILILLAETAMLAAALQWLSKRVPVRCG